MILMKSFAAWYVSRPVYRNEFEDERYRVAALVSRDLSRSMFVAAALILAGDLIRWLA